MKIDLAELVVSGIIDPFYWGMNWQEIVEILPDLQKQIKRNLKNDLGYIYVDSVEFYFENAKLSSLCEIIIQNFSLDKEYQSKYFEVNWLDSTLNYSNIKLIFSNLGISYEETKGPRTGTPIILPNRNSLLGFYEDDLELNKIFVRNIGFDNNFLNGNKYEIFKY